MFLSSTVVIATNGFILGSVRDMEYPIGRSIFTNVVGISLSMTSWNSEGLGIKHVGICPVNAKPTRFDFDDAIRFQ